MYKYNQDNKILKIEGEIFLAKHPNLFVELFDSIIDFQSFHFNYEM